MTAHDTIDPVLKGEQVAGLLGFRTRATFDAKRPALEAAGFPRKLPGLNRWSRACVLRWIETNGETHLPEAQPGLDDLEKRYGQ